MTDGKESIHPRQSKEFSNQLCLQYGLSITETKADPNRIPAWKEKLRCDIKRAMELCYDREQFIRCMEAWGYGVKWEEGHKHITYTTPENMRCRDNKLSFYGSDKDIFQKVGGLNKSDFSTTKIAEITKESLVDDGIAIA